MAAEIILFRPDLITNGQFKLDLSGWTIGTNWSWNGGRAYHTPGSASQLVQPGILFDTVVYKVKFKLSGYSAGSVSFRLGTASSSSYAADGAYEFTLASNGTDFAIQPAGTFNGYIDWVEVYYDPASAYLDLNEAVIPLNYAIADIRYPDKRNSDFSKTVIVPGTKNNNLIFQQCFEIGVDNRFNPNKKAKAIIYNEGVQVLKGYAQLKTITRNQYNNVQYEVVFFGSLANIFADLGETKLTDLDLSEYDHTYTKANQIYSWDTQITKSGSPYTNFSGTPTTEFVNGPPTGEGYVYPFIDYGKSTGGGTTYDVEDFYPAVYAKTYIDKMFAKFGYAYSSTFFNSERFKKLIIPFNNDNLKLSTAEIAERLFRTSTTTQVFAGTIYATPTGFNWGGSLGWQTVVFDDDSTGLNQDPSSQYDTSTGVFTCANTGYYSFSTVLTGTTETTVPPPVAFTNNQWSLQIQPRIFDITNNVPLSPGPTGDTISTNNAAGWTGSVTWNTPVAAYLNPSPTSVLLVAGNQYRVDINATLTVRNAFNTATTGTIEQSFTIEMNCYWLNGVVNNTIVEGDTVVMNSVIPQNVLCKDFLKGIINMFNLYVDVDKSNEKFLYIETRDDYYNGGTTRDWTQKLDIAQSIDLAPMAFLEGKEYLFSYKDDGDYYNDKYKKAWSETYGEYTYEIDNDFINGEVKTELIFAPTPLVQYPFTGDRIIPVIIAVDQNGNISAKASVIRILTYSGKFTTANSWTYNGTLSGTSTETTYGYAGHLDSPTSPSFDLSFGYPRELYYDATVYTPNNLFNSYYKKFIQEITDKNSKMVTCWLWLKPTDILTLSFRDLYYIDGHYLRLNKISDYDLTANKPTKCEFIKVLDKAPWVDQDTIEVPSGRSTLTGVVLSRPRNTVELLAGGNIYNAESVGVKGYDNNLHNTARQGYVNGNNNRVGPGVYNFNIVGSNDVIIDAGLHDVTVINTDDVHITESNVMYVNGIKITLNGGIQMPITTLDAGEDVVMAYNAVKFIDSIDAGEDVILPRGARSPETTIDGGEV